MTQQSQSAKDDLAFMRAMVEAGGRTQLVGGGFYFLCGLLYGAQCLANWVVLVSVRDLGQPWELLINVGPTVVQAIALPWWIWRNRGQPQQGTVGRAVQAAFGSAGIANIAIVTTFGWASAREHSLIIWELYPVVVFSLQGAVWLSVFMLRRHGWHLAVAAGWLVSSVLLGAFVGATPGASAAYVLIAGLALWAFMAIPGWVMIRLARKAA
jgi:hypothetical protein